MRHLEFLHESQQQNQTIRTSNSRITSSIATNRSINTKHISSQTKTTSSESNDELTKVLPRTPASKLKSSPNAIVKSDKILSASLKTKTEKKVTETYT